MKKAVFITIFHSLSSRNFFTTDVIEVVKSDPHTEYVVFVDNYKLNFFQETYNFPNFTFIPIDVNSLKYTFRQKLVSMLLLLTFPTLAVSHRLRERLIKSKSLTNYLSVLFNYLAGKTIGRLSAFRWLFHQLDFSTFQIPRQVEPYFDKYQPQAFYISDVFFEVDSIFLLCAKKKGVPSIAMVRSWDNTTNKGLIRAIPDRLIVNNEIIKHEAMKHHDIPEDRIFVGGIPQFDLAFKRKPTPRAEFLKALHLDPDKKLIVFSPAGQQISDTDWQICELLKRGQEEGKIPSDVQFLIRSHPLDPARLENFQPTSNFHIECPGVKFGPKEKVTELKKTDQYHLMDTLAHCDILLNITSTISLDCLPFNCPQILITFDGWEKRKYIESMRHFQIDEHFINLVKSGALAIANNPDELYRFINQYLKSPQLHEDERKKVLKAQVWETTGEAGKLIGNELVRFFNSAETRSPNGSSAIRNNVLTRDI